MSTEQAEPTGDRGALASSAGATAQSARTKRAVGVVVGAVAIVFGAAAAVRMSMQPVAPKAPAEKKASVRANHEYNPLPTMDALAIPMPPPAPPPVIVKTGGEPAVNEMLVASQRAPLTAYVRQLPRNAEEERAGAGLPGRDTEDRGAFERRLTPSRFEVAKAGHIGDRRFIVAQGTSIPCVLETAMQSDQPGFVSCVMPRDVLSDNGRVVLMEKGTQVVGEYRGGLIQGQTRLHVVWSRAKTPAGVIVEMGSAATDSLGRAGVGGEVDNHWRERFGAALLLSVVGDVSAAGMQSLQKSGVQAQGIGQAGHQAAAIAVEQSASIKPTLHKHQGEMVNIFVARDLDFGSVYKLEVVRDTGGWPYEQPASHGDHRGWSHSGARDQSGGLK